MSALDRAAVPTPGPWAIVSIRETDAHRYSPWLLVGNENELAGVCRVEWSAGYHSPNEDVALRERAMSNARLIAAAPELLAAARAMLPLAEEEWGHHPPGETVGACALAEIRAAVAKATGAGS